MAEATKDPHAVELGQRGGLARRNRQTPGERKAIARLGGIARAAKAAEQRQQESLLPTNMTELVPVTYEVMSWKALRGVTTDNAQQYIDERWTPRLIQFFEQLMQAYTKAGNLDAALHVAMTMAGMTSALSPARLRRQAEKALDKYGSIEPDLSHLTDEQLRACASCLSPADLCRRRQRMIIAPLSLTRNRLSSPRTTCPISLTSPCPALRVRTAASMRASPRYGKRR